MTLTPTLFGDPATGALAPARPADLDAPYTPARSLQARLARRVSAAVPLSLVRLDMSQPVISFTFDDAPASAGRAGALCLEAAGARATYYVSADLVGAHNHHGDQLERRDIVRLAVNGHEIACHTGAHLDCAQASAGEVVADCARNRAWLGAIAATRAFAFPYGEASLAARRALSGVYQTLRGVSPGVNRGLVDRTLLKAVLLGRNSSDLDTVSRLIDETVRSGGWLIVFTHDVTAKPSAWGCTPEALTEAVARARAGGAHLATVSDAFARLSASE